MNATNYRMRRRFYEIRTILFSNRVFRKFLHDMLCLVCIVAKLYNTKFSRFEEMNTYAHTANYTQTINSAYFTRRL